MKVTASLIVSLEVTEGDNPDTTHSKIIEKLANEVEEWLEGEYIPNIKISYSLDEEQVDEIKKEYLN